MKRFFSLNRVRAAAPVLGVSLAMVLAGCADGDAGLSRAEVEEVVRAEMAAAPADQPAPGLTAAQVEDSVRAAMAAAPQPDPGLSRAEVEEMIEAARPEPGLSRAEVEEMVEAAVAASPAPQPGLTATEAEGIARAVVASIPPKTTPAEYTQFFVDNAVSRYQTQGLEATLDFYSSQASVDGQWYVFIIDEDDTVIGHPDPGRRGLDVKGWVGTDANGYNFGPEMLAATADGKWVSYVYRNPGSGDVGADLDELELKNVWVVEHDGLLFASGWYIDADEFTKLLVSTAVEQFHEGGLEGTVAYFASPGSELAGLEQAIAYYNQAETVDGLWSAFIAEATGKIVAHSDPALNGQDISEVPGPQILEATEDGNWVSTESMRMWVTGTGGYIFGSGWHHETPQN